MPPQAATATAPRHWAADLIGAPYATGATGPDAWDCWGLLHHVLATHAGLPVPDVQHAPQAIAAPGQVATQARAQGWRRIVPPLQRPVWPQAWDVWLITWPNGQTHVGVIVTGRHGPRLLHADGRDGRGSVRADDPATIARDTRRLEVYRHPAAAVAASAIAASAAVAAAATRAAA